MSVGTTEDRPPVLAEVRAWISVAVVLLAHTVGMTWWAATLSADVRALKEVLERDRQVYTDHEQRLRQLERGK